MKNKRLKFRIVVKSFLFVLSLSFLISCSPSKKSVEEILEKNPDIIVNVIKKNPVEILTALNEAARAARDLEAKGEADRLAKARDEELKNPKVPKIDPKRAIRGSSSAPITIVEYSDFQCPYCSKGYITMEEIQKKYGDKIRLIYKHLPLDFHKMAMPAAKYFEAISLQSTMKAYEFHDVIFENQSKLTSDGEKFLEKTAENLGVDMKKLKKDIDSEIVKKRISDDMEEAKKFGFSGTPGFLVNGVSVRGAYPASEFEKIIDRSLETEK